MALSLSFIPFSPFSSGDVFQLCQLNYSRKALVLTCPPSNGFIGISPNKADLAIVASSNPAGGIVFDLSSPGKNCTWKIDRDRYGDLVVYPWYAVFELTPSSGIGISVWESLDDPEGIGPEVHLPIVNDWYTLYGLDPDGNPLTGPNARPKRKKPSDLNMHCGIQEMILRFARRT